MKRRPRKPRTSRTDLNLRRIPKAVKLKFKSYCNNWETDMTKELVAYMKWAAKNDKKPLSVD